MTALQLIVDTFVRLLIGIAVGVGTGTLVVGTVARNDARALRESLGDEATAVLQSELQRCREHPDHTSAGHNHRYNLERLVNTVSSHGRVTESSALIGGGAGALAGGFTLFVLFIGPFAARRHALPAPTPADLKGYPGQAA